MDLGVILNDWPYDEQDEVNNIRKVAGIDGRLKLQIRLRDGVCQWELEGRPDGRRPYGFDSVLAYCRSFIEKRLSVTPPDEQPGFSLDPELLDELKTELLGYAKRRMALFRIGDYARALGDARHELDVLAVLCGYGGDKKEAFQYDRYRPRVIAARARAEALLAIQQQQVQRAVQALCEGIEEIENFFREYGLEGRVSRSPERRALIDLRRSLRERHSIPLTDEELLGTLRAEQQVAIDRENFEMAARLRDKINRLLNNLGSTG